MRVLCDQNVPVKYITALRDADQFSVTTVESVLRHDAPDAEIAARAEKDGRVLFTSDDDFFLEDGEFGLVFFSQVENPPPGVVVEAGREIDGAYERPADICERVPGGGV